MPGLPVSWSVIERSKGQLLLCGNRGYGLENQTEMEWNRGLSSSPPQTQEYNNTFILVFCTYSSFVQYFLMPWEESGLWHGNTVRMLLCVGKASSSCPVTLQHPMVPTSQEHFWCRFHAGIGNILKIFLYPRSHGNGDKQVNL